MRGRAWPIAQQSLWLMAALVPLAIAVGAQVWVSSPAKPPGRFISGNAAIAFAVGGIPPTAGSQLRIDGAAFVETDGLSCRNPVQYSFVLSGTPRFWKRFSARLTSTTSITAVIFHHFDPVQHVRLGASMWEDAPLKPELAGSDVRYPNRFVPHDVSMLHHFSGPFYGGVAGVTRSWNRTWRHIVLTFDAPWARRRGLGTCYVPIPALTSTAPGAAAGAMAQASEQVALNRPRRPLQAPPGYASFALRTQGEVQPNDSAPRPAFFNAKEATLSCTSASADAIHAGVGVRSPDRKTYAFNPPSSSPLASPYACEGFLVVKAPAADQVASALLVLLGIGVTLTVELLRAQARRWRASAVSDLAAPTRQEPVTAPPAHRSNPARGPAHRRSLRLVLIALAVHWLAARRRPP